MDIAGLAEGKGVKMDELECIDITEKLGDLENRGVKICGKYLTLVVWTEREFYDGFAVYFESEREPDTHAQTVEKFKIIRLALESGLLHGCDVWDLANSASSCGYCRAYKLVCSSCPLEHYCKGGLWIEEHQDAISLLDYADEILERIG